MLNKESVQQFFEFLILLPMKQYCHLDRTGCIFSRRLTTTILILRIEYCETGARLGGWCAKRSRRSLLRYRDMMTLDIHSVESRAREYVSSAHTTLHHEIW